jgi:hypothetical protein
VLKSLRGSFARREKMKKKNLVLGGVLAMALLLGGFAYAQKPASQKGLPPPAENISAKRHPNVAAAQRLCR